MKRILPYIVVGLTVAAAYVLFLRSRSAAAVARQYLGNEETGVNEGFESKSFEKMMKEAGWKKGQAWCMYFAKAVWLKHFKKDRDVLSKNITGSTVQTWQNFKNVDGFVRTKKPSKGDIAIWQKYDGGATPFGHAGIVIGYDEKKFTTIEGNTDLKGGREGYIVAKKQRNYTWNTTKGLRLLGFIHKL